MKTTIGIVLLLAIIYYGIKFYVNKKQKGVNKFYDNIQKKTIEESNYLLNNLLLEYSENPTEELWNKIFHLLSQNQTYVILVYVDNKYLNDNKSFNYTNSINFRKIKNGEIQTFTDFNLMNTYVKDYISTDIILIGDFIKLCSQNNVKTITFNFTLKNPFRLSNN